MKVRTSTRANHEYFASFLTFMIVQRHHFENQQRNRCGDRIIFFEISSPSWIDDAIDLVIFSGEMWSISSSSPASSWGIGEKPNDFCGIPKRSWEFWKFENGRILAKIPKQMMKFPRKSQQFVTPFPFTPLPVLFLFFLFFCLFLPSKRRGGGSVHEKNP